jgi:Concanavalin A-like lectin/glucanases superfamily
MSCAANSTRLLWKLNGIIVMATMLTCPHCDVTLRLPREVPAGKKICCPKCNSTFAAPSEAGFAPPKKAREPFSGEDDEERARRRPPVDEARARPRRPPVEEVQEEGEDEWETEERPRSKRRKKRKVDRGFSLPIHPMLIGIVASGLLFGLVLLLTLGRYQVPFVLLGIVTGIMFFLWLGALWSHNQGTRDNNFLISFAAAAATFFIGWGITYLIVRSNRNGYLESSGLKAKVAEYASAGRAQRPQSPSVVGKVVVLEREGARDYAFDTMHYKVSEELRPASHEEVGTVVLIDWEKRAVGTYSDGSTGYQWFAQVRLIDFQQKALLHTRQFTGSPPPQTKKSSESGTGSKPDGEIADWVDKLPRHALGSQPVAPGVPAPPNPGGQPPRPPMPQGAGPKPPPATAYQGLVAYWAFDEGRGITTLDASPNRLRGRLFGARWVPGIRGQALEFNGVSTYVDLGTSPVLNFPANTAFTVAAWVKSDDRRGAIVSFRNATQDNPALDIHLQNKAVVVEARQDRGAILADVLRSPASIRPGQWHHFAVVRDARGTLELFLDGASVGRKSAIASRGDITTNLHCLGFEKHWQQRGFKDMDSRWLGGAVDEFCVFNRALSGGEVAGLAGRGS